MTQQDIIEAARTAVDFLTGLVPGAFGAVVASLYERGIGWLERFIQFSIGIIVSYYGGLALAAAVDLSPFLQQSAAFSLGLVAYKSVPGFITSFADTLKAIPGDLWAGLKARFGAKS